jgi:hypothetical protein
MGFKRNVDKNSGPTMPQNSASPKRESRNPHQTFCEFRKIHRAGYSICCRMLIALRAIVDHGVARGIPFLGWLPIALRAILARSPALATASIIFASNLTRSTQNHIQSELTNAITGTPYPSLPVWLISDGRSG